MVNVSYKIVSVNPDAMQCQVVFFTDANLGEIGPFTIDVPMRDNAPIQGKELDEWIRGFRPQAEFERRVALRAVPDTVKTAFAEQFVPPEVVATPPSPPPPPFPDLMRRQAGALTRVIGRVSALDAVTVYADQNQRGWMPSSIMSLLRYSQALDYMRAGYTGTLGSLVRARVDAGVSADARAATDEVLADWYNAEAMIGPLETVKLRHLKIIADAPANADFVLLTKNAILELDNLVPVSELPARIGARRG